MPDIPVYPGAIRFIGDIDRVRSSVVPASAALVNEAYSTHTKASEVESFYAKALADKGWHYNNGCQFYSSNKGYLLDLQVSVSGEQTIISIAASAGKMSCDYTSDY